MAQSEQYKNVLLKTDKKLGAKFMDLFKHPQFRKELVEVMTMLLNMKLNEPNIVIAFGNDF
jgi:hypothetical protein